MAKRKKNVVADAHQAARNAENKAHELRAQLAQMTLERDSALRMSGDFEKRMRRAESQIHAYGENGGKPIPMLLWCPMCTTRHVDEGEFASKIHHTHACQGCGFVWRPAVLPTVGVQFLPGYKNDRQVEMDLEDRRTTTTMVNGRKFRVMWSEEDQEYVGLCPDHPRLSNLAKTSAEALNGIVELVADIERGDGS